jgi:hypothetical protein
MFRHRITPANWRSAAWAIRALTRLRVDLARQGTAAVVLEAPAVPFSGLPGVEAVLRRREATCLERSLILQRWLAARGQQHDVVIGVSSPAEGFAAHAWLADYRYDPQAAQYKELMRLPAPGARPKAE